MKCMCGALDCKLCFPQNFNADGRYTGDDEPDEENPKLSPCPCCGEEPEYVFKAFESVQIECSCGVKSEQNSSLDRAVKCWVEIAKTHEYHLP